MNPHIHYEEEHALLRAEARRWLDERFPIARVRSLADTRDGEDPADWKELAALGWLGLVIPESTAARASARRTWRC
jgi:alkylation response protein AidB-like acyl-CoA dehydrogenase